MTGRLLIVSTPIGNLGDLSERATRAFAEADLVVCEDTRRTGALLRHLGLKKRLLSFHQHNETQRLDRVLGAVDQGEKVVVVSDAGTPLLSDPGFELVREAHRRGIQVMAVPGPSALLCALVVSGLPAFPFTFAGFPPPKSGRRKTFYRRLAPLRHTLVLFESPHRLLKSLADAREVLGNRRAVLARELTKLHEEILRGTLEELHELMAARERVRGELVLLIAGATEEG